jgi:hypothetical protein
VKWAASANWGSIADWFSAIGSIAVGVAALTVAWRERQRAVKAEQTLAKRDADDLVVFKAEVRRSIEPVIKLSADVASWASSDGEEIRAIIKRWKDECAAAVGLASFLRVYAKADAVSLAFLGDVTNLCTLPDRLSPEIIMERPKRIMEELSPVLEHIRFVVESQGL